MIPTFGFRPILPDSGVNFWQETVRRQRNTHCETRVVFYIQGMSDLHIEHQETGSKGRYFTRPDPDGPEAELTYSKAGESLIIIDHTGVPEAYRGGNIGVALVERAVQDARAKGLKILPLCPFAAAQFRRHPDWQDVRSG